MKTNGNTGERHSGANGGQGDIPPRGDDIPPRGDDMPPRGDDTPPRGDDSGLSGDEALSTSFHFTHRIFGLPGAFFRHDRETGGCVFVVRLGEINASLTPRNLATGFSILPDSPDGKMISLVERSLKYVRRIHPGDSIPNEILDGTASWTVEPRHIEQAKNRILAHLLLWLAGDDDMVRPGNLEAFLSRTESRQRVNEALGKCARQLGYGNDEDGKAKVMESIRTFSRELSYIEALQEKLSAVLKIRALLKYYTRFYSDERLMLENIERILSLLRTPVDILKKKFRGIDKRCSDIIQGLLQPHDLVAFIRSERDELHSFLLLWSDLVPEWDRAPEEEWSQEIDRRIKSLYRFLATCYPQRRTWKARA